MRYLLQFISTRPILYVTPPSAVSSAGGGEGTSPGAGAGGGGGAGSGTTAPPAASGAGGQPAVTINWETAPAQFREAFNAQKRAFEELQGRYSGYEKLGKPEDITRIQAQHTAAFNASKVIGDQLNISENELREAINQYGIAAVYDQLQRELWEKQQADAGNQDVIRDQDLNERIENMVHERLSPIQERENQRVTHEGNQLVERTISELATSALKSTGVEWAGLPNEYKNFVLTGVTEALKYDDQGMVDVKFKGATAPIQRAFQTFTAMADAYYLARRAAEGNVRAPVARPGQPPPKAPGKQPTFADMENDIDVVRTTQGKAAYST